MIINSNINLRLYYLTLFFLLILWSCKSSKSEAELAYMNSEYEKTKVLISSKNFQFNATASFALQTNAVMRATNNLFNGTDNIGPKRYLSSGEATFVVKNDSIEGRMAYSGEMRVSNFSDPNNGRIIFKNIPSDFKIKEKKDDYLIEIQFKISNGPEGFDVIMTTFYDKTSMVTIYGDRRTPIRYEGAISSIN